MASICFSLLLVSHLLCHFSIHCDFPVVFFCCKRWFFWVSVFLHCSVFSGAVAFVAGIYRDLCCCWHLWECAKSCRQEGAVWCKVFLHKLQVKNRRWKRCLFPLIVSLVSTLVVSFIFLTLALWKAWPTFLGTVLERIERLSSREVQSSAVTARVLTVMHRLEVILCRSVKYNKNTEGGVFFCKRSHWGNRHCKYIVFCVNGSHNFKTAGVLNSDTYSCYVAMKPSCNWSSPSQYLLL